MADQLSEPLRQPVRGPVRLVPSQIDKECVASQPKARDSPLRRARRDMRMALKLLPKLPNIFRPLRAPRPTDELYLGPQSIQNVVGLVLVSLLQAVLLLGSFLSVLVLPGAISYWICRLNLLVVGWSCAPFHGPATYHAVPVPAAALEIGDINGSSKTNETCRDGAERWIFINGVVVTSYGLAQNCKRLAEIFHRPITGIQNRTYGLVGDLLECIIQRTFPYNTYDARVAYDHLKEVLVDPDIHRVILICHSQGAIVASLVLDMLFAELAEEQMAKLEIYTFGSAAEHISNPLDHTGRRGVIKHIEHYVNYNDPVPQWGVLRSIDDPESRYSGRVFIRKDGRGHMFNQHYLSQMFAPEEETTPNSETRFLDQIVQADDAIAEARRVLVLRRTGPATSKGPSSPSGTAGRGAGGIDFLSGFPVGEANPSPLPAPGGPPPGTYCSFSLLPALSSPCCLQPASGRRRDTDRHLDLTLSSLPPFSSVLFAAISRPLPYGAGWWPCPEACPPCAERRPAARDPLPWHYRPSAHTTTTAFSTARRPQPVSPRPPQDDAAHAYIPLVPVLTPEYDSASQLSSPLARPAPSCHRRASPGLSSPRSPGRIYGNSYQEHYHQQPPHGHHQPTLLPLFRYDRKPPSSSLWNPVNYLPRSFVVRSPQQEQHQQQQLSPRTIFTGDSRPKRDSYPLLTSPERRQLRSQQSTASGAALTRSIDEPEAGGRTSIGLPRRHRRGDTRTNIEMVDNPSHGATEQEHHGLRAPEPAFAIRNGNPFSMNGSSGALQHPDDPPETPRHVNSQHPFRPQAFASVPPISSANNTQTSSGGPPNGPSHADATEELSWGPLHPCFPHMNPHVSLNSEEYVHTRVIRIRRDWMVKGDLAPTFSNLYPEILDPLLGEQEFRSIIAKINDELIAAFDPYSLRNWLDGFLGFLTGWIWDDMGASRVKSRLKGLEAWIDNWNSEIGASEGVKIWGPRRTGFLSLDIQIPDPKIGIVESDGGSDPGTRPSTANTRLAERQQQL